MNQALLIILSKIWCGCAPFINFVS